MAWHGIANVHNTIRIANFALHRAVLSIWIISRFEFLTRARNVMTGVCVCM